VQKEAASEENRGDQLLQVFGAALPFGGYKQPGWGHEALESYTEVKAVCIGL